MRLVFGTKVVTRASVLVLIPLIGLVACSGTPTEEKTLKVEVSSHKVTGTVTHQGKPVPYGFVVFEHLDVENPHFAAKAKETVGPPPSVGKIQENGTYTIRSAPKGPVRVRVVTDPDFDTRELFAVALPKGGQPGGDPEHPGGPPLPPGLAPPDRGGAKGGPPDRGGPKGGPPDRGGPKGGPPGTPKGGQLPDGVKLPDGAPSPFENGKGPPGRGKDLTLSADERKLLKTLHEKYGKSTGHSLLMFAIAGDADQTFNIDLTLSE